MDYLEPISVFDYISNNIFSLSSCTPCAKGYFAASFGSSSCTACPQGAHAATTGMTICELCPPGFISNNDRTECIPCAVGMYNANPGAMACFNCTPGTYASVNGSKACIPCPQGTYSPNYGMISVSQCLACPNGTYSPAIGAMSVSFCYNCPAGYYTEPAVASISCLACPIGTFSTVANSNSNASCLPCAEGTHSQQRGLTSALQCQLCAVGHYSDSLGAAVCKKCESGFYSNSQGAKSCLPCTKGKYSGTGAAACLDCNPGTYADKEGTALCLPCPIGTFSSELKLDNVTRCIPCPKGTAGAVAGLTSCSSCAPGFYSDEFGLIQCKPCANGSYSEVAGSISCKKCTKGTYLENSICVKCTLGYANPIEGAVHVSSCLPCPIGSYSSADSTSCITCPVGFISPNIASSRCFACSDGYSSRHPFSSCHPCAVGQYKHATLGCQPCLNGTFSASEASSNCSSCPNGSFSNAGASACTKCPFGFFGRNTAQDKCEPCPSGFYSNTTGASECIPCPTDYSCFIAAKNPIAASTANFSSYASLNNEYFAQQQAQLKSSSSDISRLIIVIVGVLIVALSIVMGLTLCAVAVKTKWCLCFKVRSVLKLIDYFSLKHYTPPEKAVINHSNPFGGFLTILFIIISVIVIVLSILDISKIQNKIETATVVPREAINFSSVYGYYSISVFLHGFTDSNCTANQVNVHGLAGSIVKSETLFTNNTCKLLLECADCTFEGSSPTILVSYASSFISASVIDYQIALPAFSLQQDSNTIFERVSIDNSTLVFRGALPTRVSISLTATQLTSIDALDYFFYNAFSKLLSQNTTIQKNGYSIVKNPTIKGSTSGFSNFWDSPAVLSVSFELTINPNAYVINQLGRDTITDFLSKTFALIAGASSAIAIIMSQVEKIVSNVEAKAKSKNVALSSTLANDEELQLR